MPQVEAGQAVLLWLLLPLPLSQAGPGPVAVALGGSPAPQGCGGPGSWGGAEPCSQVSIAGVSWNDFQAVGLSKPPFLPPSWTGAGQGRQDD